MLRPDFPNLTRSRFEKRQRIRSATRDAHGDKPIVGARGLARRFSRIAMGVCVEQPQRPYPNMPLRLHEAFRSLAESGRVRPSRFGTLRLANDALSPLACNENEHPGRAQRLLATETMYAARPLVPTAPSHSAGDRFSRP